MPSPIHHPRGRNTRYRSDHRTPLRRHRMMGTGPPSITPRSTCDVAGVAVQPVRRRRADDAFVWADTVSTMPGIDTIVPTRRTRRLRQIVVAAVVVTAAGFPAFDHASARYRGRADGRPRQRSSAISGAGLTSAWAVAGDRGRNAGRVGRDRGAESGCTPFLLRSP